MIGSAVRSARKRAGMTQAELARLCATSQPAIARLEKGLVAPTVVSLRPHRAGVGRGVDRRLRTRSGQQEGERRA